MTDNDLNEEETTKSDYCFCGHMGGIEHDEFGKCLIVGCDCEDLQLLDNEE